MCIIILWHKCIYVVPLYTSVCNVCKERPLKQSCVSIERSSWPPRTKLEDNHYRLSSSPNKGRFAERASQWYDKPKVNIDMLFTARLYLVHLPALFPLFSLVLKAKVRMSNTALGIHGQLRMIRSREFSPTAYLIIWKSPDRSSVCLFILKIELHCLNFSDVLVWIQN